MLYFAGEYRIRTDDEHVSISGFILGDMRPGCHPCLRSVIQPSTRDRAVVNLVLKGAIVANRSGIVIERAEINACPMDIRVNFEYVKDLGRALEAIIDAVMPGTSTTPAAVATLAKSRWETANWTSIGTALVRVSRSRIVLYYPA
jgi:hypothetical protein